MSSDTETPCERFLISLGRYQQEFHGAPRLKKKKKTKTGYRVQGQLFTNGMQSHMTRHLSKKVSREKGRRRALASRRFICHTVQFACKAGRRRAVKNSPIIASPLNFLPDITTSHTKLSKVNQLSFALRAKTCSVRRNELLAIWRREVKFPLQACVRTHDSIS